MKYLILAIGALISAPLFSQEISFDQHTILNAQNSSPSEEKKSPNPIDKEAIRPSAFMMSYEEDQFDPSPQDCSSNRRMDLPNWKNLGEISAIQSLRRFSFSGKTQALEAENTSLIKGLLYNGFTQEARQILSIPHTHSIEYQLLDIIARSIDGEAVSDNFPIARLLGCDTDADLWFILSTIDIAESVSVNYNQAIQSFILLPEQILSLTHYKFLTSIKGKVENSIFDSVARATMERVLSQPKNRVNSVTKFFTHTDDHNLMMKSTPIPPKKGRKAGGQFRVQDDMSIGYRATQFRHTLEGVQLQQANISRLVHDGRFLEAFSSYRKLKSDGSGGSKETFIDLFQGLVKKSDDVTFLSLYFSVTEEELLDLPLPTRREISQRLFALGFETESRMINHVDSVPGSHSDGVSLSRYAPNFDEPNSKSSQLEDPSHVEPELHGEMQALHTIRKGMELHLSRRDLKSLPADTSELLNSSQDFGLQIEEIFSLMSSLGS